MKLSLTLPTLFPEPAMRAIENVRATVQGIDYEIVVASPHEFSGPDIRWVKEDAPRGAGIASDMAAKASTGDVICPMADDAEFAPGWAQAGLQTLMQNERGRLYAVGIGQLNGMVGTVFGIYYPFFPMVRRSTVEKVGGFFRPQYKHHFTDSDFAFRIWSAGGECGWTPGNYVTRLKREADADSAARLDASRNASLRTDTAAFLGFWRDRYGRGWETGELRDFNIDVDPIFRMFVDKGSNTIFFNDPAFADAHRQYRLMMAAIHQGQQGRAA